MVSVEARQLTRLTAVDSTNINVAILDMMMMSKPTRFNECEGVGERVPSQAGEGGLDEAIALLV